MREKYGERIAGREVERRKKERSQKRARQSVEKRGKDESGVGEEGGEEGKWESEMLKTDCVCVSEEIFFNFVVQCDCRKWRTWGGGRNPKDK
ncbi:MAG: hypothetical protein II951_11825 [Bacteroidales bacterium]|nr:hypothetical protein [Bacteroidales bacterium]